METQNQTTQRQTPQTGGRLTRRVKARNGLLDFLVGIGGTVSTYHPRFNVLETEGGYTIVHRGRRWLMRFDADGSVEILAGNDSIRVADGIWLNERHVGRICIFGWKCFDADELRLLAFTFVAIWYWRVREQALRRLACMLNFGKGQTSSVEGPDEYVYGDLSKFLLELGRALGMSKLEHKVSSLEDGYIITHRNEKWHAKLNLNGDIEIITSDGRVRIVDQEIHLDDVVDEVCKIGQVCLGAHEIRIMLFIYIVLWYWHIDERDAIRRSAQMVRPCR